MRATGLITLLALVGCNPDTTITRRNDAPEAEITAPESGVEVREGDVVTFAGTIVDADDSELVATWFSGGAELCAAAPVADDGTTTCEAAIGLEDDLVVLEGRDPDNAASIAVVDVHVVPSDAPSVEIVAPDGTGPYYSDHPVAFEAMVGDGEDAATDLVVAWTDETDALVTVDDTPEADGTLLGSATFTEGPHAVTLSVVDTTGKSTSTTVAFAVGGPNQPPVCTITSPLDGASVVQGTSVDLVGTVTDADVAEDLLLAEWSSDRDGVLSTANADASGNTTFSTAALSPGLHTLTLTGTDEVGGTCTAVVTLDVSAPPTVVIDLPLDGDVVNDGDALAFSGTVSDDSTAADALALSWESDLDGVLDTAFADSFGIASFSADWLTVGTHTVTFTATDEAGLSASDTVTFVVNGLPTAPTVEIDPSSPAGGDDLVANVTGASVDPEGDPIAYTYAWYTDGVLTAYTGATVPAGATARGETWDVYVTPNDGYGDGDVGFATVVIGNTAPELASVTLSPDPAYAGDIVTCSPGSATDADGDAIAYTYAWSVGGTPLSTTTDTLDATAWARGDTVTCTVTPTDGTDAGTPVSASLTIANSLPSLASVEISPESPAASDTLTCTATGFSDADGDADQSTYAWYVDGVAVGTGTTLAGGLLGGQTVECTVTPFDGTDVGAALTAVVIVDNTPPVLADVTLSPAEPTESDILTCSPGVTTDADGTTSFAYTYAWTVDGAVIAETGNTLDGSAFDKGEAIACTVTPNDGAEDGAAIASNVVTAVNTPPDARTVAVAPASPSTDDTLTASATGDDVDGDSVSFGYTWYVNGSVAGTGATLPGSAFDNGDTVYVVVVPNDGEADGTSLASTAVTIANTAPVLTGVTLTPTPAYESSTLTCSATGTDADGDAVTFTYAWTVNGAAIAATAATLTGTDFDRDDTVVCTATPSDGSTSGASMASSAVTIDNTAPALALVTITPSSPTVASTLTCSPTGADDDGDAITYSYAWFVNGVGIGATTSTLSTGFGGGDLVYCRVTPTDGTDVGAALNAPAVTIGNTAPVLTSVTLTPTTATESSTLTCTPTATDADGDAISYAYAWYVNGSAIGANGSSLTGTDFDGGDAVYCVVTPTDGSTAGTAGTSNTVTISNTAPVLTSVTLTPTSATEASTLTCSPTATDADGDAISYTYAWYVNGSAIAASTPTLTGSNFDRDDAVYCRVTPSDGTAGTAMSSNTVTVSNTAPVLASVTLTPTSPTIASTLTCAPSASDADSDAISYTYAWYVNGSAVAGSSSTLSAGFGSGDSIYCRVTPTDGTTAGTAVSSNTVTVGNTAPVISSVTLTPTTAYESSTLTCSASATDADGDAISYTYAWYVNGSAIAATSSTLSGTNFARGNTVYCTATPSDGTTTGTAGTSNTVTISNTAPVLSSVVLTPTSATEASTLTCTPSATDADSDAISYTYAWYVNGSAIAASSSTLTGTNFDRDDTVYCRVTPSDGTAGTAMSSNTVTVANTAPVLASVTLTPTSPTASSTLTCTPSATDTDSDAISYTYAWYVNGSAVSGTSSSLNTGFGSGDTVYCRVTPTDGTTAGTAMSSNTVTIANTAPVIASVTLTPTTAYESSTLTCTPTATDADGDAITYTYAWYVNGSAVAATSSTLTGTYFAKTNTVYCTATPSDGTTTGTAGTSNTVTISNTAPALSAVTLTPTTAYESSTLTCTPTASDADGDAISYTYAWYVNGSAVAATTSTLSGTYFSRGNTVYCSVTPSDGTSGTAMASNTVTISNTAPVLASVTLTPTSPTASSTLTCTPSATDADSDAITYTYAWYVNGSAVSGTSSTLATGFGSGDTVYCRVTPTDGTTAGTAVSSNTVTIANTAPVISSVTLTPTTAYESSTLTCTPSATDADGDTISYTYAWYVNGSAVAATSSTLTGTYFSKTNTVYCTATPSDGTTSGTAGTSNTVTISNTAPVISTVALTPTSATEASTLTCTPSATDADGDSLSYTYAWYVNGSAIAATSSTLTGTYFSSGNTVYCRATPSDGSTSGTAGTSNTVTISNTAPVISSVTLTPTTAYETSTLTCTPSATDADGDAISYTYAWYVNGSLIAPTTSTLTGTYFSKSNTVYCRATPSDGTTSGTAGTSNTVTISNSAPVISSVTLTPTTAYESSTLTCSASGTDADGSSLTYSYAWYVNGTSIGRITPTLSGTYFSKDDAVYCTATPSDGTTSGAAGTSNTVTISNTVPTTPTVVISPTAPVEGVDDILCDVTVDSTDADGDTVDYDITWTVDGVAYPGAFSGVTGPTTTYNIDDTIPAADTHFGTTWECTVVPFDEDADGATVTASVDVVATCGGIPTGTTCSGQTIRVGYVPGWGSGYNSSSSLAFSTIATNSLTYGGCTVSFTNTGSGFTLATLSAYDVIFISDPSGGSRLYTTAEKQAIRDYLEGGYGGAVATYLMYYLTYDNSDLMDLFGVDSTTLVSGTTSAGTTISTISLLNTSHPLAYNLSGTPTLLSYNYEQNTSVSWDSTALLECAEYEMGSGSESSVIANDGYAWRSVYFTGMPEYNSTASGRQAIYNAILWTAGYR